jgi:hypothetical protein
VDAATLEVTQLVTSLVDAWNNDDAQRFSALFADDAEYRTGGGVIVRGQAAIARLVSSASKIEWRQLRCSPDGARIAASFRWRTIGDKPRAGIINIQLQRSVEGLRIVHLANIEDSLGPE